jgi:hypothetical protein
MLFNRLIDRQVCQIVTAPCSIPSVRRPPDSSANTRDIIARHAAAEPLSLACHEFTSDPLRGLPEVISKNVVAKPPQRE